MSNGLFIFSKIPPTFLLVESAQSGSVHLNFDPLRHNPTRSLFPTHPIKQRQHSHNHQSQPIILENSLVFIKACHPKIYVTVAKNRPKSKCFVRKVTKCHAADVQQAPHHDQHLSNVFLQKSEVMLTYSFQNHFTR